MKMPEAEPFLYPVDSQVFPEYYETISHPMDLSKLKENIPSYESKDDFLADAILISLNCAEFNDPAAEIVKASEFVVNVIRDLLAVIYFKIKSKHIYILRTCKFILFLI